MYTLYQCWNLATVTTEGFADAVVPTNVDTNNSIKTLAQLATDLQSGGGLKVPGVQSLANNVWHTSLDGKNRVHYGANARTYFGSQDGYEWKNKGDGNIMTLGDNGVQSVLNDVWHTSLDGKNRVNYATNSRTYFGSQNGYEWRNKTNNQAVMVVDDNGDLTAYGNLNAGGMNIVNAIKDLQARTIALETKTIALETKTTTLDTNTIKDTDKILLRKMNTFKNNDLTFKPFNAKGDPVFVNVLTSQLISSHTESFNTQFSIIKDSRN